MSPSHNMSYNVRKLQILVLILKEKQVTSQDVADRLGMEIHSARMQLLRYHRQGLLSRGWDGGPDYDRRKVYRLTRKGFERIEWLRKNGVGYSASLGRARKLRTSQCVLPGLTFHVVGSTCIQ